MLRCSKRWAAGLAGHSMNNLGRRLKRLEARLQPPEDKMTQHIIHFVEGDGTVTGSMVFNHGGRGCERTPRSRPSEGVPLSIGETLGYGRSL
jgi:hypothetical protein